MDWMNRGDRPGQPAAPQHTAQHQAHAPAAPQTRTNSGSGVLRWGLLALAISAAILILAVIGYTVVGGGSNGKSEDSFVNKKQMQAVFLNGGQVYFGNITALNGKFLSLKDIYYLRVNQQVQPNQSSSSASNDISLVKLGCELHGPQDTMVINREQIIFWENLKDDGQVAKAVEKYKADNPNGQNCNQASGSSSNATTGTGTNAQTNNAANSTTTKKQ